MQYVRNDFSAYSFLAYQKTFIKKSLKERKLGTISDY